MQDKTKQRGIFYGYTAGAGRRNNKVAKEQKNVNYKDLPLLRMGVLLNMKKDYITHISVSERGKTKWSKRKEWKIIKICCCVLE